MTTIETQWKLAGQRWTENKVERDARMMELKKLEGGERAVIDWEKIDSKARIQNRMNGLGMHEKAEQFANDEIIEPDVFERILNDNELTEIVFFERGLVASRSVGRVVIFSSPSRRLGHGSGVMVSPRLFLTNNHVLKNEAHAEHSMVEFGYLTSIGGLREAYPFRLAPEEFFVTDEELDFTLVAVQPMNEAGAAVQARGHCPMIPATGKAVAGQRVNIIQHPRGERMQVSMRGNRIVDIPGNFLHYETDTEPGSSGSPVFNDQWEMAALHHAGVPGRNDSGKILLNSGRTWRSRRDNDDIKWVANEGVRISRIVEHLKGLSLEAPQRRLFEQTQRPPEPMDLWDLIEGLSSPTSGGGMHVEAGGLASNLGAGMSGPHVGPDGSPSWLFRLNFGPVVK